MTVASLTSRTFRVAPAAGGDQQVVATVLISAADGRALSDALGWLRTRDYLAPVVESARCVGAKVLVEAMRRTQPLTGERLADSLRSIQSLDLGGYWVTFARGSQSGSRFVDLSIVNAQGRVTQ